MFKALFLNISVCIVQSTELLCPLLSIINEYKYRTIGIYGTTSCITGYKIPGIELKIILVNVSLKTWRHKSSRAI